MDKVVCNCEKANASYAPPQVISDDALREFSTMIPFMRGSLLPDGRRLGPVEGSVWGFDDEQQDSSRWSPMQWIRTRFDPADKTVLELGCLEGLWTLRLAAMCRHVTAVEIRPRNICATLVRLFVHDVRNVRILLQDAQTLDEKWAAGQTFDLLYHYGVLYHLTQPVEHLFRIAALSRRLFLGTHFCREDTPFQRDDITYAGRRWRAGRFVEGGWNDPFSGVEPFSRWLFRDDLLAAVAAAGYPRVESVKEYTLQGNLPYIWIIAERP